MAEPSDNTKKTASSMFSRVGKSALGGAKKVASSVGKLFTKKPENVIPRPSGPTETLGEIFKMMKIMDEDRKLNQEMASAYIEEQKHEKDRRNNEIIKALTARKPPRPPRVKKEKKVEEKKLEEKKAPEKKEPEKKVEEKKPAEKKAPEKKPPEKKVEEKKAEESANKVKKEEEARKARESAERVKKEEEARKARESAERVKKEETKKSQEAAKTTAKKEEKPAEVIPQVVKKVPPITGTDSEIKKMIMQHEGKVNFPYKDSKGLWTIGVGHLINGHGKTLPPEYAAYKDNGGPNDKKNNRTPAMTDEQINELFEKDYVKHKEIAMKTPGWNLANENGQSAMIDLSYNMGEWFNTKEWRNSNAVKALKAGNFESAADHLKDSLWYQQVKGRAVKIVNMMRNGKKTDVEMAKTIPASSTSGTSLDQSSKTNADGKKELNAQQAQSQQNINVINQNVNQTEQKIPDKPNDTNPLLAKVKGQPK
jgi:GH24 family phage-related lysozyme (muramidase)